MAAASRLYAELDPGLHGLLSLSGEGCGHRSVPWVITLARKMLTLYLEGKPIFCNR